MTIFSIINSTAVLPTQILENATITIEDGIIIDIAENGPATERYVNAEGGICMPGIIDSHSDGFEMEPRPRPSVRLPLDFSIQSFEAKVRAAGVTTLFHGIGFENDGNRTVESANAYVDIIHEYSSSPTVMMNHRVLYRLDARDADGFNALCARIESDRQVDAKPLVSFEDHTPGQGQYRDRTYLENWIMGSRNMTREEAVAHVDQILIEREAVRHNKELALPWLTEQAALGNITLMAHDPATPEDVAEAVTWNASIAEFPTSVEAAQAARAAGLRTVCGAPNALRGSSHSGNVSATELISLGLCDGLSSDYLPFAMLGAVGTLVKNGTCTLPEAVRLVTYGPAETVGVTDRGRLEVGLVADVVVCRFNGNLPSVLGVWRANGSPLQSLAMQGV